MHGGTLDNLHQHSLDVESQENRCECQCFYLATSMYLSYVNVQLQGVVMRVLMAQMGRRYGNNSVCMKEQLACNNERIGACLGMCAVSIKVSSNIAASNSTSLITYTNRPAASIVDRHTLFNTYNNTPCR